MPYSLNKYSIRHNILLENASTAEYGMYMKTWNVTLSIPIKSIKNVVNPSKVSLHITHFRAENGALHSMYIEVNKLLK